MTDIPKSSNAPDALVNELANLLEDDVDVDPWTDSMLALEVRANWWRLIDAVTGVFEEGARDALTGDDLRYVAATIGRDLAIGDGDPVAALQSHAERLRAGEHGPRLQDSENVAEALVSVAAILERLQLAGLLQPMLTEIRAHVRSAS